jgi:hypothetical protein
VADPEGRLELTLADPGALHRYRFGLRTADFLVCGRCGAYVAAVIETGQGLRSTLNVNVLDDRDAFDPNPPAVNYDKEGYDERLARRAERWTPTTIVRDRT